MSDTEIAKEYGMFPWQYYAQTTPRQRLFLRLYFAAKAYRLEQWRAYEERRQNKQRR